LGIRIVPSVADLLAMMPDGLSFRSGLRRHLVDSLSSALERALATAKYLFDYRCLPRCVSSPQWRKSHARNVSVDVIHVSPESGGADVFGGMRGMEFQAVSPDGSSGAQFQCGPSGRRRQGPTQTGVRQEQCVAAAGGPNEKLEK
jgi:hypothetical protein